MSTEPNKGDIVERLIGVTDKYPGFRNLNTEAAAEIRALRSQVADLTAQRDAMVEALTAAKDYLDWQEDPDHNENFKPLMTQIRAALALCQSSPGTPKE